jgi:hypothetical protein
MNKKTPLEQVLKAIPGSLGIIGVIAKRLGVDRSLILDYHTKYPEVAKAIQDEEEGKKDLIESAFIDLVNEGNERAILFGMKTLCKDRGYNENQVTAQINLPLEPPQLSQETINTIKSKIFGL